MKYILILSCAYLLAQKVNAQQATISRDSFYLLSPVELKAVRAGENAPFSKTNISSKEIKKANLGMDLPFLLNQTPAVVVNADAGNGIGYTGIRIRGTDATRINVTLNGIPYNDAESQGTFFVDLPDFLSSAGSVQVQRGVGTSSNGAGAFGANINISSNETNKESYVELNNSFGSFNSRKHTIKAGTGVHNGFNSDLRLSNISSDGFIDRASSKLHSLYFSSGYTKNNTGIRLNIFSGKEKTYQAWYGISEADLIAGRRTINYAGTEKPGSPYDNETDNYTQTHYQLFFNQKLSSKINFNTALFYSRGKGYYEQYKASENYADYLLPYPIHGPDTSFTSDLVRQLWLDNHYYGNVFAFHYKKSTMEAVLGGAITWYEGNHFGKVVWAEKGLTALKRWYDLDAFKNDQTIYLKQQNGFSNFFTWYYDLQVRHVNYNIEGFRYNPNLLIDNSYTFFNPKAGISYERNKWKGYASVAIANKEPNRDDFEAGTQQQPKPERLYDVEAGIEKSASKYNWAATLYYMNYQDQLVLTGKINDVGAYTRTNIPKSYRAGIELQARMKFNKWLDVSGNISLSENRIKDFTEYIDDYDNGGQKTTQYNSSTIAFSPSIVSATTLNVVPAKDFEMSLTGKYVSRQYLDNTSNRERSLDPFFVSDFRVMKTFHIKKVKEINLVGQVYNLFDTKYEPNGYTFSYISGGSTTTENYYFPMAGRNFMIGLNLKF